MGAVTVTKRAAIPTNDRQWRSLRVNPILYGLIVVTLFLGVIGAAQAAGLWSTSGRTAADGTPAEVTGADPVEVKGWMTIGDVLAAYQVPRAEFDQRFGIPSEVPDSAQLKELEEVAPDFSVTDLRVWLAERQATP